MKARHICAVAGVAIAACTVVFMQSLVATNDAQAPEIARRISAPWQSWKFEGLRMRARRGAPPSQTATQTDSPKRPSVPLPSADLELKAVAMQIDYRPDGRVLQGPPMTCVVAPAPSASPYGAAPLCEGRWVDDASEEPEVVCTRSALRRFGRGKTAALGSVVNFIGEKGSYRCA